MNQPPYGSDQTLGWQAYVVAQTSSAMLGLLSPTIRSVAVRVLPDGVELHFAVPLSPDEVAQDIEDICFELDVRLEGHVLITPFVHRLEGFDWSDHTLLGVYAGKPATRI
jgi:hypothetical protein